MAELFVVGQLFDSVAEGVAVIQDGSQPVFLFVDADDFCLDLAAAENQVLERFEIVSLYLVYVDNCSSSWWWRKEKISYY